MYAVSGTGVLGCGRSKSERPNRPMKLTRPGVGKRDRDRVLASTPSFERRLAGQACQLIAGVGQSRGWRAMSLETLAGSTVKPWRCAEGLSQGHPTALREPRRSQPEISLAFTFARYAQHASCPSVQAYLRIGLRVRGSVRDTGPLLLHDAEQGDRRHQNRVRQLGCVGHMGTRVCGAGPQERC